MVQIRGETVIARPVGEVFDFVADERNEPKYNPHMSREDHSRAGRRGYPLGGHGRIERTSARRGDGDHRVPQAEPAGHQDQHVDR
jgi:hypothetical protein